MNGLPIRHHVPYDSTATQWPCIWCGQPTPILAETPFRPDLGALPLMLTCGAHMRIVYRQIQAGRSLDAWESAAIARLMGMAVPRLGDGRNMNILLLASHSVAEYDDLRMLTDMGHDVFCPGGYQDPRNPGESLRPALPDAPLHPDLIEACEAVRREKGDPGENIDWAKAEIPDIVLEWADTIICHHFPYQWVFLQWERIKGKRVIWRTCGQSNPATEEMMSPLRKDGLQIVRYSPKEKATFEKIGPWAFAGEDAVIRFGKYPEDYGPWIGDRKVVGNVTQWRTQDGPLGRGDAVGLPFWEAVTQPLDTMPAGPGSEALPGGVGELTYPEMLEYLRHLRTYLYLGTRPASYTLGLIEAMMSGVPVISIPAGLWGFGWGGASLFEDELAYGRHVVISGKTSIDEVITGTRGLLSDLLKFDAKATNASIATREIAVETFGIERIQNRWRDFLDGKELTEEPPVDWLKVAVTA